MTSQRMNARSAAVRNTNSILHDAIERVSTYATYTIWRKLPEIFKLTTLPRVSSNFSCQRAAGFTPWNLRRILRTQLPRARRLTWHRALAFPSIPYSYPH